MEEGVTLVTDSHFFSWTPINRHLPFRTCVANKTATPPTVVPSVELSKNEILIIIAVLDKINYMFPVEINEKNIIQTVCGMKNFNRKHSHHV